MAKANQARNIRSRRQAYFQRPARFAATLLSLFICPFACASNPVGLDTSQDTDTRLVLAAGEARHVPETDLTLTFVRLVADSRCPTGVTCIREGDASVLVRVDRPGSAAADLTLHTSGPGSRDGVVDDVLVTLIDVMPYPREDQTPRPEEYRVTLLIRRK
jgi:hypothetical protein